MSAVEYDKGELKCMRKAKENPFVAIRMAGFFTTVGYRLFKLKICGCMTMSVHLKDMGVMAQGFVMGAMTIGIQHDVFEKYRHEIGI
uniref:HIG1 domain-containing protein n=1 Tax=Oncorhynchus kisutch TaxID=8019 RepID=A0A8C7JBH5_ONCKI